MRRLRKLEWRKYDDACNVLDLTIRLAADPTIPNWSEYVGHRIPAAVWWAKYTMREARALGFYPTTAELEAEQQAFV